MSESISTITYRDVPGYAGYRVGSDGSVWSCLKVKALGGRRGTTQVLTDHWRRKAVSRDASGYLSTSVRGTKIRVHILILLAFVGPCPDGMECCHGDGNRANSTLSNLRWGTHSENMRDRNKHGTQNTGERNGMHKLTETDVRELRRRYVVLLKGMKRVPSGTHTKLAGEFGVSISYVQRVVRREVWKHVE